MVQHADGTQEATCSCGAKMTLREGGESPIFDRGDVGCNSTPDVWHCEACGKTYDE